MICPYNGIQRVKQGAGGGGELGICIMDGSQKHHEWKKPNSKELVLIPFIWNSRIGKPSQ